MYREAIDAKELLVSECKKASIIDSIKEFSIKRVEGKAGALRRVVTDTVDIWSVVDREKAGEIGVKFVAGNPNRLPNVNAEKFNVKFLISAIVKLQETVDNQTTELSSLKSFVQQQQQQQQQ